MTRILEDINSCTGCGACYNSCVNGAITMKPDDKGFSHPIIDSNKCTDCLLCQKKCPQLKQDIANIEYNQEFYAFINKDSAVLKSSTSGGAFTLFANYILDHSGCVYGAVLSEDMKVYHIRITNKDELDRLRGSKYVQSDMRNVYVQIKADLNAGLRVLFCGTPCQCDAVRHFFGTTDTPGLLLVDFVCHGVPSPKLWADYVSYLEKVKGVRLKNYYFRPKIAGWHIHIEKAVFEDGSSLQNCAKTNLFSSIFHKNLDLRPCCYKCRYINYNRPSDITIADFWGIEKIRPELDNNKGTSLVIINSERGKTIFDKVKSYAIVHQVQKQDSAQRALLRHAEAKENADDFWRNYSELGFEWVASKYAKQGKREHLKYALLILLHKLGLLSILRKVIR